MIAVLSPAKTLDYQGAFPVKECTQPELLANAAQLVTKLKKLNAKKIAALMDVSEAIAQLNYERFQTFSTPFNEDNAKAAISVFKGDVYLGMQAETFNETDLDFAQNHLRILSGLYGVLRPKDLMQAYRLEMGTAFKSTATKTNLYQYWGDTITQQINKTLDEEGSGLLVNLASQEYFKAVNTKKIKGRLLHCEFKDEKNGQYKIISFFAKKARGMMANYIVKNQIDSEEQLMAFDYEGYVYSKNLSSANQFVFTRTER